ncbi:MAG: hypothetical protein EBW14_08025 [Oxalobacteraceae bacterium]|jgi:hypothetical protein|nr:hypothetical protein [Oxalobacteraceae bacterium]
MVYFTGDGKIVYDDYPIAPTHEEKMSWKNGSAKRVTSAAQLQEFADYISGLNAIPDDPTVLYPNGTVDGSVKPATTDLILFKDDTLPVDIMTDLIFENIGGQELINIVRSDLVNGQNILYQPIKNLSSVYFQYNPQNILGLQDIDSNYFKQFPINFSSKIPECGTGPNCSIVYIDEETGDLIINVINLAKDEQVEVSIISDGIVLDDTIYEV